MIISNAYTLPKVTEDIVSHGTWIPLSTDPSKELHQNVVTGQLPTAKVVGLSGDTQHKS